MKWDYSKLRGRIREISGSEKSFSLSIGVDRSVLSQKLNQKFEFKQSEIISIIEALGLTISDIPLYFFTKEVEKTQRVKKEG